jgi:hypothetical protein
MAALGRLQELFGYSFAGFVVTAAVQSAAEPSSAARQLERLPASVPRHLSGRAHPATPESEKILFNQLNRQTGNPSST